MRFRISYAIVLLLQVLSIPVMAAESVYGPRLEGFEYPYPVSYFAFESQGQPLEMAYLDVQPPIINGHTVVLMHGKNFCAATWHGTIDFLADAGYRVIAPDQVGFCKSSKPENYQFSFHQLSANTSAMLNQLNITRYRVIGHSMGGMLATRHALQNPDHVEQLILVNPIGLEDWLAKGVPYQPIEAWYQNELKTNSESIRQYQKNTYYAGTWQPDYDRWVQMQAGLFQGPGQKIVAWNSALVYDMILTQPVFYEFQNLKIPTVLLIGEQDTTAVGKNLTPASFKDQLGDYPRISREIAERIPGAKLILFEDLGHSPQIQAPARFHQALLPQMINLQH